MKKTPKEWYKYHWKKRISYCVYIWSFDGRKKENKIPLKTKITENKYYKEYVH